MNPKNLKGFVHRLKSEKERLVSEISRLEESGIGDTMSDSVGELSVYDNHPADIGDELFERSKDVALRDNAHLLLERVERALAKIDEGTYGLCDHCGKEIDFDRLEALPYATQCIDCQRASNEGDMASPRPLEEDVLQPPFHRSFLDTDEFDNVGFDGEDALQAVLRYGSSDSPQDIPGSYDYKSLFPNSNEHQGIVERTDAIPNNFYHNKSSRPNKSDKSDDETEHG